MNSSMDSVITFFLYGFSNHSELPAAYSNEQCWIQNDDLKYLLLGGLGSLPIILGVSFIIRRQQKCLNCCYGRPGVAYPWEILTYARGRVISVLAMVLICFPSYLVLTNQTSIFQYVPDTVSWLIAPLKMLAMLIIALLQHPIFMSASHPTALTSFIALLSVGYQTIAITIGLAVCGYEMPKEAALVQTLYRIPSYVAGLFLLVLEAVQLFRSIRLRHFFTSPIKEHIEYYIRSKETYVKALLARRILLVSAHCDGDAFPASPTSKSASSSSSVRQKLSNFWSRVKYKSVEGFYYPLSVICCLVASSMLIYYVALYEALLLILYKTSAENYWFKPYAKSFINDTRSIDAVFTQLVANNSLQWNLILASNENLYAVVSYLIHNAFTIMITTIILTSINGITILVLMFISYRENVLNAYAGKYINVVNPANVPAYKSVVGLCLYGGCQVGYVAWAMFMQNIVYALLLAFVWYTILLPLVFNFDIWFVNFLHHNWPTLVITAVVFVIQFYVPYFLFVASRGKKLAIKRRSFFLVWSYYSFIVCTAIGLISCILRLVKVFVIAFVFLARLDWCSLPPQFRFLDGGHLAYMGQIHTDVAHSHPIVIVFIEILQSIIKTRESENQIADSNYSIINPTFALDNLERCSEKDERVKENKDTCFAIKKRKSTVMKWLTAYTLVRNPSLCYYRKRIQLKLTSCFD